MKKGYEKFLMLFHNKLLGMLLTDEAHRVTDINDHLLQLIDLERHEAIGKTTPEMVQLDESLIKDFWKQMDSGKDLNNVELGFKTKLGKSVTVLLSTQQIEIDDRLYWLTTITDISRKKKAEEAITDSELRFRTLTSTAPVGIFETDENGNTIYVNEAWMNYTGLSFGEAVTNALMNIIHPDDREREVNAWIKCIQDAASSISEYRIINKAGDIRWVNGKAVPLITADGKLKGYIGTITDVTEIKQAMELLQQSHQALNERTEQLQELSTHLQQVREEERTNIAREIHDELGQQLTGLKLDLSWLKKKMEKGDAVVQNKFDDAIQLLGAAVKSIRRIVTELRPSMIDDLGLHAAFDWQIADFSERLGIKVNYRSELEDAAINPDIAIGLFRILQESLTNIARHAKAKHVIISIEKVKDAFELVVQDDGVGFDTTSRKGDHSFGLLGIKERVYMLKGDFHLSSLPGEGTRIKVRIPAG